MEFTGKSDFLKFYKYILLKDERKTEKKIKRKKGENRRTNVEVDDEDTFESFRFEKLSAFSVPIMMSPIARTPRREREDAPIPEDNQIVVSQNEDEQVIYYSRGLKYRMCSVFGWSKLVRIDKWLGFQMPLKS